MHVLNEKSILASKIEVSLHGQERLYSILGSYVVPTRFLAPLTASKIGLIFTSISLHALTS